jgi:hypothetical protein
MRRARPAASSRHVLAGLLLFGVACTHDAPAPKKPSPAPLRASAEPPPSSASADASPSAPPSAPPTFVPPAPCVGKSATQVKHVEARGAHALICFDPAGMLDGCVDVDPATGTVTERTGWSGPADTVLDTGRFVAKATARGVDVCPRSGGAACKHVTLASDPLGVATSDDGSRAFAFTADVSPNGPIPWRLFGELWDVAANRRIVRRQLSSTMAYTSDENVYSANFVGGSLLLRDETADRSAGIMGLWDGALSRAGAWFPPAPFVALDGATWATATNQQVTFVDTARATELPKPLTSPSTASSTTPGRGGLLVMGNQVLWAWASPPGFALFDRRTHVMGTPRALPVCP